MRANFIKFELNFTLQRKGVPPARMSHSGTKEKLLQNYDVLRSSVVKSIAVHGKDVVEEGEVPLAQN